MPKGTKKDSNLDGKEDRNGNTPVSHNTRSRRSGKKRSRDVKPVDPAAKRQKLDNTYVKTSEEEFDGSGSEVENLEPDTGASLITKKVVNGKRASDPTVVVNDKLNTYLTDTGFDQMVKEWITQQKMNCNNNNNTVTDRELFLISKYAAMRHLLVVSKETGDGVQQDVLEIMFADFVANHSKEVRDDGLAAWGDRLYPVVVCYLRSVDDDNRSIPDNNELEKLREKERKLRETERRMLQKRIREAEQRLQDACKAERMLKNEIRVMDSTTDEDDDLSHIPKRVEPQDDTIRLIAKAISGQKTKYKSVKERELEKRDLPGLRYMRAMEQVRTPLAVHRRAHHMITTEMGNKKHLEPLRLAIRSTGPGPQLGIFNFVTKQLRNNLMLRFEGSFERIRNEMIKSKDPTRADMRRFANRFGELLTNAVVYIKEIEYVLDQLADVWCLAGTYKTEAFIRNMLNYVINYGQSDKVNNELKEYKFENCNHFSVNQDPLTSMKDVFDKMKFNALLDDETAASIIDKLSKKKGNYSPNNNNDNVNVTKARKHTKTQKKKWSGEPGKLIGTIAVTGKDGTEIQYQLNDKPGSTRVCKDVKNGTKCRHGVLECWWRHPSIDQTGYSPKGSQ